MLTFLLIAGSAALIAVPYLLAGWVRRRADKHPSGRVAPSAVAALVLLSLATGVAAGLYGPAGLVQLVYPASTSYEDVLFYWFVTVPGVPLLLTVAVVRRLRAIA